MDCNKTDCIHYKVCEEWKSLGNDNYINESNGNCDCYSSPYNPSGDCISREDLKEDFKSRLALCNEWIEKAKDKETKIRASAVKSYIAEVIMTIDNAPTVEPDLEFAKWVTNMIFDNQVKDFDFEMFSELACRKLEKMGLVEKTENEWIKKGGADMRKEK